MEEKSSPNAVLYFCRLNGRPYCVKEFSGFRHAAIPPEEMLPGARKMYETAMSYYAFLQKAARAMQQSVRCQSPLNIPLEVFVQEGRLCKVTRWITDEAMPCGDVHGRLSPQQIDSLIRSALLQLNQLKEIRLVDGDLKPENLMVRCQNGVYTVCLLDYDGGFFEQEPPLDRSINFTPGFSAPEVFRTQWADPDSPEEIREAFSAVTCAADMYSLGCVWAYYLTQSAPGVQVTAEEAVLLEQVLTNGLPCPPPAVDPVRRWLISRMLQPLPENRPAPAQALRALRGAEAGGLLAESLRQLEVPGFTFTSDPVQTASGLRYRETQEDGRPVRVYAVPHIFQPVDQKGRPVPGFDEMARLLQQWEARLLETWETVLRCAAQCPGVLPFTPRNHGRFRLAVQAGVRGDFLSLAELRGRRLRPDIADQLMLQLLEAMQVLHQAGLLYGGLTEDCVFLSRAEGEAAARAQLGCAFLLFPAQDVPEPDLWPLSCALNAPEAGIYRGAADAAERESYAQYIGPASDVFSLGLIYHQLLCGEPPRPAEPDSVYVFNAITEDESGDSVQFSPLIDARRLQIIRRMTRFQPQERPRTCTEAAQLIRSLAGG